MRKIGDVQGWVVVVIVLIVMTVMVFVVIAVSIDSVTLHYTPDRHDHDVAMCVQMPSLACSSCLPLDAGSVA